MSHNLRVETGRWSRTPRELRVCHCSPVVVQDEEHVLIKCPLSQSKRQKFTSLNFTSMESLMSEENHVVDLCMFIYEVISLYGN